MKRQNNKMTFNKLASLIAQQEGKKHQASIGDIREILKILMKLTGKDIDVTLFLSNESLSRLNKLIKLE